MKSILEGRWVSAHSVCSLALLRFSHHFLKKGVIYAIIRTMETKEILKEALTGYREASKAYRKSLVAPMKLIKSLVYEGNIIEITLMARKVSIYSIGDVGKDKTIMSFTLTSKAGTEDDHKDYPWDTPSLAEKIFLEGYLVPKTGEKSKIGSMRWINP